MIYILNSPVLTAYGEYCYQSCEIEQARRLLDCPFVSAVGHAVTAQFLSELLDVTVAENRIPVVMQAGDQAVIFALKKRLAEGQILDWETIRTVPYELALLQRTK